MALTVDASRPAQSRQAVIFCCDQNYYPYAMLAASQLVALHPDRSFDICVCSLEPLVAPPSLGGLDVRNCTIRVEDLFSGFSQDSRRTATSYIRIVLPEAFLGEYDRILYLDSDIFIQGGDFNALLGLDLGSKAVGAIRDNMQWRTPRRRIDDFDRLGLPQSPYFNSGVLLYDVHAFHDAGVLPAALQIGRTKGDSLVRHDQSLLNAVLRGEWAELSPMWNWQYSWAARLFEAMQYPHIVHFIGTLKPWADRRGEYSPRFAQNFDAFIARHFPGRPRIPVSAGLSPDAPLMRKMLVKHYLSGRKLARYLERFPSDMTVIR